MGSDCRKCFFEEGARAAKPQKKYVNLYAVHFPQVLNKIIGEVGDLSAQRGCEKLGIYEDKVNIDGDMRVRFLKL